VIANAKLAIRHCEEKQRLRLRYSQALKENDRAVDNLVLARGKPVYARARALRDEARSALNTARVGTAQARTPLLIQLSESI
jgi:hypothetical protein